MKRLAIILLAGLTCGCAATLSAADVSLINVRGAIGPATASYIARAIDLAGERGDACLVIQLDTPGGLLDSTKDIVGKLYESRVPTVVYVAPAPARAASAGAFITMAADIAAMAPHTRIGAAHPVSISMGGEAEKVDDVMKKKQENDTSSFAESIAEKRHRNVEWAKSAVVESASITAEKALELKVIDLIAGSLPDLLERIDGREVNSHALHTARAKVLEIPMTIRESFLHTVLRGVAGAIALILVLCMSAILPINTAGLALVGLAIGLFIADVFAPTHGVLTFGGILSFFLGSLMLFNRGDASFRLSLVYIIPATLVTAAFFTFVVTKGLRAQFLPVRSGKETMLGKTAPALARIDGASGKVFVEGEYWNAISDVPIEPGQAVVITAIDGLTLKVKPKQT